VFIDTSAANIWADWGRRIKRFSTAHCRFPNAIVDGYALYSYPNQYTPSRFTVKNFGLWVLPGEYLRFNGYKNLDMDTVNDGGVVEFFRLISGATWQNAFNNPYV